MTQDASRRVQKGNGQLIIYFDCDAEEVRVFMQFAEWLNLVDRHPNSTLHVILERKLPGLVARTVGQIDAEIKDYAAFGWTVQFSDMKTGNLETYWSDVT